MLPERNCWRRASGEGLLVGPSGEGLLERDCWIMTAGEGPRENACWRRNAGEGLLDKD